MAIFKENEKESLAAARAAICPLIPGLDRVIVIQIQEKVEKVTLDGGVELSASKTDGGILLLQGSENTYTSGNNFNSEMHLSDSKTPVKAVLKAVGKKASSQTAYTVGEEPTPAIGNTVYVFPNVFEAKTTIDGVDYMVYHERDIVQILNYE